MRSAISIDVAAAPEVVFALARDVERWPRLLPHYEDVRILERLPDGSVVARMIARRPLFGLLGLGLPVAWRSRTWSEPETCRIRFVHQGGATNGMDVTWRIEATQATEGGCRVTIEHDFRPRFAPWAWFIDTWFTRPIAGRTLATFKAIAEALAGAGAAPATEALAGAGAGALTEAVAGAGAGALTEAVAGAGAGALTEAVAGAGAGALTEAVAGAGAAPATEAFAGRSSRPTKGADSESPPASAAESEAPAASKRTA